MSDRNAAAQALREYGAAIRGYWGGIDGRSVRDVLDDFADEMDGSDPTGLTLEQWRDRLGICPEGDGHWTEFCDDDCGKTDEERYGA